LTDLAIDAGKKTRHQIRGERVYLRPAERNDIPLFVRWFNDAETASYLSLRAPMSIAAEQDWYEKLLIDQGKSRWHFVMCLLDGGQPIGTIGLFDLDQVNGSAGMGIMIGEKSLWGKGLGTDSLNALLDFAFGELRFERVWLEVNDDNVRGKRSYEKCGFKFEGTERHAMYRDGRYRDIELMSILRDEWAALSRRRSWEYENPD
jgi:RimJ/RimL family protein N-acetyltransferase